MSGHSSRARSAEREEVAPGEDVSSSDSEDDQVELLVTSREKRSTAGTRMSTLLEREGDDELELLFAEDEQEEDDEFEEEIAEDGSDVQLDSASSDDEQGPAKDDDDLEGEKELQRQTRVERQKKRKAQDAFLKPGVVQKRVKVASRSGAHGVTASPSTPAPKSKKKGERSSWLPTPEEGPVRASSRKQTVQNKEIVHSRLVASEKRRMKQLQVMQEAAKRKEASRPKAMTQAQRMEEAARTERLNAKSLNRWEMAEKKRSEEQKAKLEALHNRQLTGPVISWWSGMARWVNGKLQQVGWKSIREAEEESTLQAHQDSDRAKNDSHSETQRHSATAHDTSMSEQSGLEPQASTVESDPLAENENAANAPHVPVATPQRPAGFLDGIHYYASLPEKPPSNANNEHSGITVPPAPQEPLATYRNEPSFTALPLSASTSNMPKIEHSARTLVRLENFDANGQRLPELQNHVLLKKQKLTQAEKQSKSFIGDPFHRTPADLKFQKQCVSYVRSQNSQHGIGTPRRVYHMQIHMHTRRYKS
ncbi:MAG: hypothetical protein LQ346_001159 [Caloplaca aetnensis]|nr:MAG: hypothetical protein LQ346_001159 [Caloplaca aetnensis]